jgi:hypothetical protein
MMYRIDQRKNSANRRNRSKNPQGWLELPPERASYTVTAHSLTLVQTHEPLSVMLRRIAAHLTVRQLITLLAKTRDGRLVNCLTSGPKKGAAHFCSAITAAPDHRINVISRKRIALIIRREAVLGSNRTEERVPLRPP